MNTDYFMGIDNGGSATKCILCDRSGHIIASASTRIPMQRGSHGETERPAEHIWEGNCRVIRSVLESAAIAPARIACVSFCSYGGGLTVLDHQYAPVIPSIVSTDTRANDLLQLYDQNGTAQQIFQYTHQQLWAGQAAVLLPWWKRHDPHTYSNFTHVLSIKDYIRFCMTGRLSTEATDASNTNLFDLQRRQFHPDCFAALDIPEAHSFFSYPVEGSAELCGTVSQEAAVCTGLLAGTPVATGLYDAASCCLAAGVLDESRLCLVMGTWSICCRLIPFEQSIPGTSTALCSFRPDMTFWEEASPTSASNLDWFLDQLLSGKDLCGSSAYDYCNQMVADVDPASSDLIFLPYLYSSNTVSGAKACFFNLSSHHTLRHMLAAVYEGIVFSMMDHVHRLCPHSLPPTARLSGGPARSAIWSQMLCDLLGIPLEILESTETGALGSAMCAAAAVGAYSDLPTAAKSMNHIQKRCIPNAVRHLIYQNKYRLYQRAVEALKVFYR